MSSPSSTLDGLPKQFVSAMRTLFDIMDDKHTGFVSFSEIENRWQDDNTKGLPKGVIESLRKVTPSNGMLSFERFCAGLKICLLRNQVDRREAKLPEPINVKANRPPSAPLLDIDNPPKPPNWGNTAAIRPNNVITQQRTLSMPQLLPERKEGSVETVDKHAFEKPVPNINKPMLFGPPKPPRSAVGLERAATAGNLDRAEIRTALQNWQMGVMMNDQENKNGEKRQGPQYNGGLLRTSRSMGDGKAAMQGEAQGVQAGIYQKKPNPRRREPRRHTLQNGIDYSMLKRMKQIEQEKEVLMQGLSAVEKARDWYMKQVSIVQDKMKYLGRMGHVETIFKNGHQCIAFVDDLTLLATSKKEQQKLIENLITEAKKLRPPRKTNKELENYIKSQRSQRRSKPSIERTGSKRMPKMASWILNPVKWPKNSQKDPKKPSDSCHPLFDQKPSHSRLKSRKRFLSALLDEPSHCYTLAEIQQSGISSDYSAWRMLNRLRTGVAPTNDDKCDCGAIQNMNIY
uniref:Suppressor APC domain-containing protein 2 n=1 Tax=Diabrotica virgifera virgifera TaxID=50390 RepID=A0A6P7G0K7_DIAVI